MYPLVEMLVTEIATGVASTSFDASDGPTGFVGEHCVEVLLTICQSGVIICRN